MGAIVALTMIATLAMAGVGADASSPHDHEATAVAGVGAGTVSHDTHEAVAPAATRLQFHDAMRRLWEDHVTWTRMFIVSFAANLPDLGPTTDRLLQNQVDIGDAIKPFYGDPGGDRLTQLLTEHITTAAELLTAAKAGDGATFDVVLEDWYRNGRQIARYLHRANPDNWPLRDLRTMMREHLDLTLSEAANRLAGDYAQDISDYEAVHLEILHMADMLSRGIIRQFPGKFV